MSPSGDISERIVFFVAEFVGGVSESDVVDFVDLAMEGTLAVNTFVPSVGSLGVDGFFEVLPWYPKYIDRYFVWASYAEVSTKCRMVVVQLLQ
jgi:hypothetical protein